MLTDRCSEMLDRDSNEEIELFLKQDLISGQDVSVDEIKQKRSANEQGRNTTDDGHGNILGLMSDCSDTTDRVDNSPDIQRRITSEKKGHEKRGDQTEIFHGKRLRDSDMKVEREETGCFGIVESGTYSLKSVDNPDNVSGSKVGNRAEQNLFDIKAKDVTTEAKYMGTTSFRPCLVNRDLSPLWDSYILAVKGIPPKESGRLKRVLNDVLGVNRHRVRPRQRGDTIVHLHFITQQDMRIAEETLTTQGVPNYRLTVTVESPEGQKVQSEDVTEGPESKKMKHSLALQFYEEAYDKQVEFKVTDISSILQDLEKDILSIYPMYSGFIGERRLQHDGVFCAVDKVKECPAAERIASTCWFAVGIGEETGQLALGIYQGGGHVRKLSLVRHNYPDHVVRAAEAFEEFLLAEESRKICRKLLIYTNRVKELMLLVFIHDISVMRQVADEMRVFFTSGDGAKCHVTSIHVKVMKSSHDIKEEGMQLVFGVPSLHETVAGLKLQLPPLKNLWNTIYGADMLCQAVAELLVPSREMTVLDIGCGIGLLGLYLSKMAGEVLGTDTHSAVAVATTNATLNGIAGCKYFAGVAEAMIPVLAKKRKYDSVCAVVTCCINNSYRSERIMEELRKIQHLDRLVLIEDRTMPSGAVLSLNKPSSEKKMGKPFFPLKVVPVDSLPNSKGYVLLVLLERVGSDDMNKFGIDSKLISAESELETRRSELRKSYERDSKPRLRQGDRHLLPNTPWNKGVFVQQISDVDTYEVQKCLLQNALNMSASHSQLQAAEVMRVYGGTVNSMTNVVNQYELRQMEDEYYRRRSMEGEQRRWLAEEQRRRLVEEVNLRGIEREEWKKHMHDGSRRQIQMEDEWIIGAHEEQLRRSQEEECRRIEEWRRLIQDEEEQIRHMKQEEERRRIQEEKRRTQIQEEYQRRQFQVEQMRRMQEEEYVRRMQEEEYVRRMQEEEYVRRMQEDEQRRRIQQEGWMRQIHEEELVRRIREEEQRRICEDEWRRHVWEETQRQMEDNEWRRKIQEEERRKQVQKEQRRIKEEEWRRKIYEEEQRKQPQEGLRMVQEEDWRRQMQGENQKIAVLEEICNERVREEELRRQMKEEIERDLLSAANIRNKNDLLQGVIADSLRAAAVPQLPADTAQKVKRSVAEAVTPAGAADRWERHGDGSGRNVAGDNTVPWFGMAEKEVSPSRHMEEEYLRYIREVESARDHGRDSAGAAGRYSSEQNDLKAASKAVSTKTSETLPSLLELNLRECPELRRENSYSAHHSGDRGFCLDVDTNQRQGRALTDLNKSGRRAEHEIQAKGCFNIGKQAGDLAGRDQEAAFSCVLRRL